MNLSGTNIRHVGDLCLLGRPVKAHIIAVRPGHSLNSELSAKILDSLSKQNTAVDKSKA